MPSPQPSRPRYFDGKIGARKIHAASRRRATPVDFVRSSRNRERSPAMTFRRFYLITLLIVTLCAAAAAQDTASLTGTVKDSSGATIANAQVVASNADHGIKRPTVTNSDGDYSLTA